MTHMEQLPLDIEPRLPRWGEGFMRFSAIYSVQRGMKLLLLEHRTALETSSLAGEKALCIHLEQKALVYLDVLCK